MGVYEKGKEKQILTKRSIIHRVCSYYIYTMEKEILGTPVSGIGWKWIHNKTVEDQYLESSQWKEGKIRKWLSDFFEAMMSFPSILAIRHQLMEILNNQNNRPLFPVWSDRMHPDTTDGKRNWDYRNENISKWRTWIRGNKSWHDTIQMKNQWSKDEKTH